MRHVFVSPHMDDAVFSAGELILSLVAKKKKVLVVTVFTEFGDGPISWDARRYLYCSGFWSLTKFSKARKQEDIRVMIKLGVDYLHLGFIDGGFRLRKSVGFLKNLSAYIGLGPKFIYPFHTKKSLFSGIVSNYDKVLLRKIYSKLEKIVKSNDILYGPICVGNHADHLVVREVSSSFKNKKYFWVDQPYIIEEGGEKQLKSFKISYKKSLSVRKVIRKMEVVRYYKSQVKCLYSEGVKLAREKIYEEKN